MTVSHTWHIAERRVLLPDERSKHVRFVMWEGEGDAILDDLTADDLDVLMSFEEEVSGV